VSRSKDLALHNVPTRLAHELARLARYDPECMVCETHGELASRIGTSQQEVTRGLQHLVQEGLIAPTNHRHGIMVLDVDSLASYIFNRTRKVR